MENIGMTYDLFVQNELQHTSHSLEWLPISHQDPERKDFEFSYFLLGTHAAEGEESAEPALQAKNQLQLARVRLPTTKLTAEHIGGLKQCQGDFSRMEIVCSLDHCDEVIKARAMPQDLSVVASMTNTGAIKIYDIPEAGLIADQGDQFDRKSYSFTG